MKVPALHGIDLSQQQANAKQSLCIDSDDTHHANGKSFSRLCSRTKEIVADDVLDEDLICTPPLYARTLARSRLSNSKRHLSEVEESTPATNGEDVEMMSERRRALFEPLGPNSVRAFDSLLPPPDFDVATYPRGWVIGKKRKLVNVDVVESMRRIAVQEMNRKDREISGLNEQLEEDARTMEHLQKELQQERQKRLLSEREKETLQAQTDMLMTMLNELEEEADAEQVDDCQVINN